MYPFFKKLHQTPKTRHEIRELILSYLITVEDLSDPSVFFLPNFTSFKKDLGMDSLDIVELIQYLEKQFNVDLDEIDLIPPLETIGQLTEFIWELTRS